MLSTPPIIMKWHNLNVSIRIKLSVGASLLFYALVFMGILWTAKFVSAVEKNIIGILFAWTTGFGGFLAQQHGSNKLDVEAAKSNAVTALNAIKDAAVGARQTGV